MAIDQSLLDAFGFNAAPPAAPPVPGSAPYMPTAESLVPGMASPVTAPQPVAPGAGITVPGFEGAGTESPPSVDPLAAAAAIGPDVKTTTVVPTAGFNAATAGLAALTDDKLGNVDAAGSINQRKAGDIADLNRETAVDSKVLAYQQLVERQKLDEKKQKASDAAAELREKHAKDYERGFFEAMGQEKGEGKAMAARWGAALSAGLGAFAATFNGTPNYAMDIIMKNIDRYTLRERGRLLKQKEEIERAGGDVKDIDAKLRDFETITVPQQRAALLEAAGQRRTEMLSRYGVEQAQVDTDALKLRIKEEALKSAQAVEAGLAKKVEYDDSEQKKLLRTQAMGTSAKPLTEGERTAVGSIRTAMTAVKDAAAAPEFSKADKALIKQIVAVARDVQKVDPTQIRAAIEQVTGTYYKQLSDAGRARYDNIFLASQDLERNLSGGAIGGHEIASLISKASEPGGLKHIAQRARDLSIKAGSAQSDAMKAIDGDPAEAKGAQTQVKAGAAKALRSKNLSAEDRSALEAILANPSDPRAATVLGFHGINLGRPN